MMPVDAALLETLTYWAAMVGVLSFAVLVISAICRRLKVDPESLIGVTAKIRPFKSREEYLKMLYEGDLGELLERAYITPQEVIRKKPKSSIFDGAKEARERLIQIQQRISGGIGGTGTIDIRQVVTPENAPGELLRFNGVLVKMGGWYRNINSGELMRLIEVFGKEWGRFAFKDGSNRDCDWVHVELATPRKGEWWEKKPCDQTHCRPGVGFVMGRQQWGGCDNDYFVCKEKLAEEHSACECGCLVPENFGLGTISEISGTPTISGIGGSAGMSGIAGISSLPMNNVPKNWMIIGATILGVLAQVYLNNYKDRS